MSFFEKIKNFIFKYKNSSKFIPDDEWDDHDKALRHVVNSYLNPKQLKPEDLSPYYKKYNERSFIPTGKALKKVFMTRTSKVNIEYAVGNFKKVTYKKFFNPNLEKLTKNTLYED